jgi:hypothetical protein
VVFSEEEARSGFSWQNQMKTTEPNQALQRTILAEAKH